MRDDIDFSLNKVISLDKASQRRLDKETTEINRSSERRAKRLYREEARMKDELRKLNMQKELSRQSVGEMECFLNNLERLEKTAGQATVLERRSLSLGQSAKQGAGKIVRVTGAPDQSTIDNTQDTAKTIVNTTKRDVALDDDKSGRSLMGSARRTTSISFSRGTGSCTPQGAGNLRKSSVQFGESSGESSGRRKHLQMASLPGLRRPSINIAPSGSPRDQLCAASHPGFRRISETNEMKREKRQQQIADLEALLQEGVHSQEKQEMLEQWIKVLSNADDLLSDPESSFDLTSDGKVALSTSKRCRKRRLAALEEMMSQYLPGQKTKNPPLLTPNEALHCSYLRLPPRVVDEMEELCRDEGVDPGIHAHMTEDQVDQYFLRNDLRNQRGVDDTDSDDSSH